MTKGIFDDLATQIGQKQNKESALSIDDENLEEESFDDYEPSGEEPVERDGDDSPRTEIILRNVAQELLRYGLLEESHKPNLYRAALNKITELNTILEPLDLVARADEVRGLVFLVTLAEPLTEERDDWSHPLVRKQRFTMEQTLLVAILRKYFVAHEQEAGTGSNNAIVSLDEIIPEIKVYFGDPGSEARERSRVTQLLEQLKTHGLVTTPDQHGRITIRPIIAHLANPENLSALLQWMQEKSKQEDV